MSGEVMTATDARLELLRHLADPVRLGVLERLERGEATASRLALELDVSPTQLANHLRRLRDAGLVSHRRQGRHAAYALAEPGLRELFSVLNELGGPSRAPLARRVPAGTCFDHLSGALGVALFDALVERGALVHDDGVRVTDQAAGVLGRLGVTIPAARRRLLAYACLDSAEGRPHLGGALGAELARVLVARGWVETVPGSRRVEVTEAGRRALSRLGITGLPRSDDPRD